MDIPMPNLVEPEAGSSLSIETYGRMRQDILSGVLPPLYRLKARQLGQTYQVGLSPVREALNRLLSEGLVSQSAQRGFAVSAVCLEEFQDISQTRQWVDERGLRASIAQGDATWEERVIVACHRLSRVPRTLPGEVGRNPLWYAAHKAFHLSLLSACNSARLLQFSESLHDANERYLALSFNRSPERRPTHQDEHQALTDAVVARDAKLAVDLLLEHYSLTAELVRRELPKFA